MRLRQEQILFLLALSILGAMSYGLFSGTTRRGGSRARTGDDSEFTHYRAPTVDVALQDERAPRLSRELFSPPRDTHRLAPLELVEPPRDPLAILLPPTDPGPAPLAYGALLRRPAQFADEPGLFDADEDAEDDSFLTETGEDEEPEPLDGEPTVRELLEDLQKAGQNPFEDETPGQREARYRSYRGRYDWIQRGPGQYAFGRIVNENRFGLVAGSDRANEPIRFVEVDPVTGKEKLASVGAIPVDYQRDSVTGFGFAETVANEIELRRARIHEPLTRGGFEDALSLASFAVRERHSSPRALEVAEELNRLCIAYDPKDIAPRLGLGRTLEAGFRFEEAFEEYRTAIAEFQARAEPLVAMALLEERFLLFEEAEARLRQAVQVDGGNWRARSGLGGFLSRRGRHEEALPHLTQAVRSAPSDPERLFVRVRVRVELGDAYFALGQVEQAQAAYEQALDADRTHQRAKAGALAASFLAGGAELNGSGGVGGAGATPAAFTAEEGEGFELLLVRGVMALSAGSFVDAKERFLAAAEADPLRASRAFGALAFLALATGNDGEAFAFVDEALERDPNNAYALYLRGRMLGTLDDYEGAREALLGALDKEIDFEDALVALGEVAFRLGRFEDAERYLERAVSIDASRPDVLALRGINLLRLELVPAAREAFDAALRIDPSEPTAKAGRAWCEYLSGDVTEALIQLADLDDARRDQPEDDPWRVWAREQSERVAAHDELVEWTDNFNRTKLINDWRTRESDGVVAGMLDGAVKLEGTFDKPDGRAQVLREYVASDFVSFTANVRIHGSTGDVKAGIFIAREQQRRRDSSEVVGEASVSRHEDGRLQLRFVRQGQPVETLDMQQSFPLDQWVRLSIERAGVSSDTTVRISLDGVPLVEGVKLPSVGGSNSPLFLGLFVEGDRGRNVLVEMDEASVVYKGNRR